MAWSDWRGCAADCGSGVNDRTPQEFSPPPALSPSPPPRSPPPFPLLHLSFPSIPALGTGYTDCGFQVSISLDFRWGRKHYGGPKVTRNRLMGHWADSTGNQGTLQKTEGRKRWVLHFTLGRREAKFTVMDIATNVCVAYAQGWWWWGKWGHFHACICLYLFHYTKCLRQHTKLHAISRDETDIFGN